MPGTTEPRPVLPLRLQQIALAKAHEDRIQRSGPQPDLQPQLIAIPPRRRIGRQSLEHLHGLRRGTARPNQHLDNSTYVEFRVKTHATPQLRAVGGLLSESSTARGYNAGTRRALAYAWPVRVVNSRTTAARTPIVVAAGLRPTPPDQHFAAGPDRGTEPSPDTGVGSCREDDVRGSLTASYPSCARPRRRGDGCPGRAGR